MEQRGKSSIWTPGFIMLSIGNLFMAMAFYQLIPTLPVYIKEELGGDKGDIGMIMAFFTVSALLIRPFTGVSLDRYGRKWIFLASLLVFSLFFSGYMLAGSLAAMAALRFAHGLAWGATTTAGSTVVVDILPRSRMGEGIGFYGLSMTLAMALGPLLGVWMTKGGHYEWVFIETAAMSLMFFIMASFVKYPVYKPPSPLPRFTLAKLFEKTSWHPAINMLMLMIPYGGIMSFIAIFGKEQNIDDAAAYFFIFCGVGIAMTRYFAGRVFDRLGPRTLLIAGICFEMSAFPVLTLLPGLAGFMLAALLLGLGVGIAMPTIQAMVNKMVMRDRRGAANSTLFTAIDIGIGLGMVSLGHLGNAIGLHYAFLLSAGVCLIALLYFVFVTYKAYNRNLQNMPEPESD